MLSIHLLGRPRLLHGEVAAAQPRGRKAWALLAYLLLAERPHDREHLASVLFPEADDPLRALRWNLAELRRALGLAETLRGGRISLALPEGSYVDVHVLTSGSWAEAVEVPGLDRELLAGMDFPTSPGFEAWLLNQRRHLSVSSAAALREGALSRLAVGDATGARELAARLVALDPLNESGHALLIRAYVAAGDDEGAGRQLAACTELLRREMGVDPGPEVAAAIRSARPPAAPVQGGATGRAHLEAGLAALKAGVLARGIDCLSRAAAEADAAGEQVLKATAMFELGSALVHCGQCRYEEGAAVLHEVLPLAAALGDPRLQAATARELAWVELLAARYQRCETWLRRAIELADGDQRESAAALWVLGMALTEVARYPESMDALRRAIVLAEAADDPRGAGIAQAMLGKAHLMRGELDDGRPLLEQSLERFRSAGWTWLLPWPEAYLGELELFAGNRERAKDLLEHAFSLATEIADPCFCSKAEANLGLLDAIDGRTDAAASRLESARMWLIRTPDHTWSLAYALDAACMVGAGRPTDEVGSWIDELEQLAGRAGMREFVARAYVHRFNVTGDEAMLHSARALAADIDNPRLHLIVDEPERLIV